MSLNYKEAGVDIDKGDEFVERIKSKVQKTYNNKVVGGVGGFACLYDIGNDKYLAAGTDGVGTKLKIAQQLKIHNTIGIDLVAMCANDVICTGAKPQFFMDYLATGKLDICVSEEIVDGIVEGCHHSEMALIGGETAEMPGMYQEGEYDLAGFCVGEVNKSNLIDGSNIKENDYIIGLPSSGIHSNGFSLVRKLINHHETDLLKDALTPTKLYVKTITELIDRFSGDIHGLAHITGGGIHNISRLNKKFNYHIDNLPPFSEIPSIFETLASRSKLSKEELYKTFNMGIGFTIITSNKRVLEHLRILGQKFFELGIVKDGNGSIIF